MSIADDAVDNKQESNNSRKSASKRKSLGPKRSSTPLDDFFQPGVVFRFPDNDALQVMPATFVSLNRIPSTDWIFSNIPPNCINQQVKEDSVADSESVSTESLTTESLSDKEDLPIRRRRCVSCGAGKTPYWRDGWAPGVILCNACGIRYHKYRRYCEACRCIVKKDEQGRLQCPKCLWTCK